MQQEWDDLDGIIKNSFEDIDAGKNYNSILMSKICYKKRIKEKNYSAAFSLIIAGFMFAFIYTSNIGYRYFNMQYEIKTEFALIQQDLNSIFNMIGE